MVILILLFQFSFGLIDESYSLVPPFAHTSIGEIGNWSIRGQAVSQKRIIHLTSTISGMNGGLCHLAPTTSEDWMTEIEISISGDTFIFTFGKQICPNITSRFFNALNLTFTPSGENSVTIQLTGPEIFSVSTCSIKYNFHPNKLRIRVSKTNQYLSVSTVSDFGAEEQKCFSQKIGPLYSYGYLSLLAFSPKNCHSCITNIYSNHFFVLSKSKSEPADISKTIENNRKYLEESKNERQFLKMMRRSKMLTVSKYVDDVLNNNFTLNPNLKGYKISDSLLETKEMVIRARRGITAENLTYFINNKLIPVIDRAAARFERVSDALWQMKAEMLSLWDDTSRNLRNMNYDIKGDCNLLKSDVEDAAEKMREQLGRMQTFDAMLKGQFPIDKMLFLICVAELIAYLVFIARYHQRTLKKQM